MTQEEQRNPLPDLTQEGVQVRPVENEVLLVGCKDRVALDLIKATFAEKFKVYVMSKDIFNRTVEAMIASYVKWDEDQKIAEYCRRPENIKNAMEIAHKVEGILDTTGKKGEWFVAGDIVDNTNFTYKQARTTMEMLFTFGFAAQDVKEKNTKYLIIANPEVKLKYVDGVIEEMRTELNSLESIRNKMAAEIEEGKKLMSEVKEKVEDIKKSKSRKKKVEVTTPDLKVIKSEEK